MTPKIKAMLVMAQERRSTLVNALESCGIDVLPVCDCKEARRMLEAQPIVRVVVTDARLPDSDWRRVLEIVERGRRKIEVVVCSRLGDPKLWSMSWSSRAAMMCWSSLTSEEIKRIVEAAAARSYVRSPAQAISHKPNAGRAAVA